MSSRQAKFQATLFEMVEEELKKFRALLEKVLPAEEQASFKVETMVPLINKEIKKAVVRIFETLSDEEIDAWQKVTEAMLDPVYRRAEDKMRPLCIEMMQNFRATLEKEFGG